MSRLTDLFRGARRDDAQPATMIGFPQTGGVLPYGLTATSAAGLPTVWRCLDVLANGVSQLSWSERRLNADLPLSRLTRRPSTLYTRREWTSLVVRTLALYDVCYLLKVNGYDSEGVPMGLWPVPPQIIVPRTLDTYAYTPPTQYVIGKMTFDFDDLVILRRGPMPGIQDSLSGVINLARAKFGEAMAAQNYASRYWQAGGAPTTVLETDANLSEVQNTQMGNRWAQRRSQGPDHPAILSNGLKARAFGADPVTQSAVDARLAQDADIAKYFGIPSRLANVPSNDPETYHTAQEANMDLVRYTLRNYIQAIEDALTDLLPGQREMVMMAAPLTEGTEYARAQALDLATGHKAWLSVAEARDSMGLPPQELALDDDESQKPLMPMASMLPAANEISVITGRPTK